MFSALRRRKDDQIGTEEWLQRTTKTLLRQLSSSVVKGSDMDLDWLRLKLGDLEPKLEHTSSASELLELLDQVLEHLNEYNVATTRYFHRRMTDYDSAMALLNKTLGWAKEELDASAVRLSTVQQLLERAANSTNPVVTKSRLAECSVLTQEAQARQKRLLEQSVTQLQDEISRLEARRQREEGNTSPFAQGGGMTPPKGAPSAAPAPPAAAVAAPPVVVPPEKDPPAEVPDEEDSVTGLSGRGQAARAVAQAVAEKRPMFVVAVAVERLAMIEERYGESLRDDVLVHFAQEYGQALGADDSLFRWGGSSFLALLKRSGSKEWVQMEIDRLFNVRFKKTVTADGRSVLLNLGTVWKMWSLADCRGAEVLMKDVAEYLKDR